MAPERFLEGRLKGHLLPKMWCHLEELTVSSCSGRILSSVEGIVLHHRSGVCGEVIGEVLC